MSKEIQEQNSSPGQSATSSEALDHVRQQTFGPQASAKSGENDHQHLNPIQDILKKGFDVAEVFPYALYYGGYEANKAINQGPLPLKLAADVTVKPFTTIAEATGLAGDVGVDVGEKLFTGGKIGDEGRTGSLAPSFIDKKLSEHGIHVPQVYLPGVHPDGKIDFQA